MQKSRSIAFSFVGFLLVAAASGGDSPSYDRSYWKQPPVGCVEDLFPQVDAKECGDLSHQEIDGSQIDFSPEGICVSKEFIRRNSKKPEDQADIRMAWLLTHALENRDEKIKATYDASEKYGVPPQFLYGVMNMESIVSDLPIMDDYGNYSCGIGSFNIQIFCRWISDEPSDVQAALGWPKGIACDDDSLPAKISGALWNTAFPSKKTPWLRYMDPKSYTQVSDAQILSHLPGGERPALKRAQLAAIRSFSTYCRQPKVGVQVTAHTLRYSFDHVIPAALREQEKYAPGETFDTKCMRPYPSPYYPLQSGWLLTYGVHNMGDEAGDLFGYYYHLNDVKKPARRTFTPQEVLRALYQGGKIAGKSRDRLLYRDSQGELASTSFHLACAASENIRAVVSRVLGENPLKPEPKGSCDQKDPLRLKSIGRE